MDKTFNELFDDFFKRNDIKPEDKLDETAKENAKKLIEMLNDTKDLDNIDENVEKEIDDAIGKPDRIEFYNEGNVFFEKRIWHTQNGDIEKIVLSDDPSFESIPMVRETLKKQLTRALELEQYEKAAEIRDLLKKSKNKKK